MVISMKFSILAVALLSLCSCRAENNDKPAMETAKTAPEQPKGKVVKSDDQWKKDLTPEQFRVLRKAGTEPAFNKTYEEFKHQGEGTYYCGACGAELFTSKEKFDSGCGWPSFYDPSKAKNVVLTEDHSGGMTRTEVSCAICGSHLGHVFSGEGFNTPTDQRYCINGVALKFVPAGGEKPKQEKPAEEKKPTPPAEEKKS